jgi:hypothetical protein
MNDVLTGALVGAVVGGVMLLIFAITGSRRQAGNMFDQKPTDLVSFTLPVSRAEAYNAILEYAHHHGFKVEIGDPTYGRVLLGQNMGLTRFHNGIWLPIYLQDDPGGTTIEVGVQSKTYQAPFALNILRNRLVAQIKTYMPGQNMITTVPR